MIHGKVHRTAGLLLAAGLLSACASMENFISTPTVQLNSVQLTDIDITSQTFLLGFDIVNPNSFPLPIANIEYGVSLDGYRFASGETGAAFTVPANGDSEFAISVNLDLMQTAPTLFWIVRDAARRDIPYKLEGQLGVDIPLTKPVPFKSTGNIRLLSQAF